MIPIAIKGHPTRGKEVIELLEMFGYVNYHKYSADCDSLCFYGGENTSTIYYDWVNNCEDMHIFSLEEFLEKYPYKLNELVLCDDGLLGVITKMEWDCEKSDMKYHISFNISDYNKWYNSKNIKCKFMAEKDKTNIAIKGHSGRGKEVIEILEMMGGKNTFGLSGDASDLYYFIDNNNKISYTYTSSTLYKFTDFKTDFKIFTVEEFREKYPYKVGNKVQHKGSTSCDSVYEVEKIQWVNNRVEYTVKNIWYDNCYYVITAENLQLYKETMNTNIAITGHKTRYKEVIKTLEMLGGINKWEYVGDRDCIYYINEHYTISYTSILEGKDFKIFTFEEFLEKYPYKVGDKVTVTGLSEYPKSINFMKWFDGDIHYSFDNETWFLPSALNLYKEETMEVKRIAIVGHKTRGKEVIEILEMLGGINTYKYSGENEEICFAIGGATKMIYYDWISDCYGDESSLIFTLEEFLEKYSYKVGDRVRIPEYESEVCINKMLWNGNEVLYEVVVDDEAERYSAEELNEFNEPNKKETITIDDFKANTKEWLIDKLHDMVISKAIKTIGDIHEELHKPQYPKTYDECVNMFNCTVETVNLTTVAALRELIYCRNAYWKIAGEQMGLGKPWEPKHTYDEEIFFIYCDRVNGINKGQGFPTDNFCLSFPTKEMRDEFCENFKELIEKCKEFL